MTDFPNELDDLAKQIAKDLKAAKMKPGDRIKGFQALTNYYAATQKHAAKAKPETTRGFARFRETLNDAQAALPVPEGEYDA